MKKVLLLLAVVLAFTFSAMAQTESKAGDTGQATTTKAKKSKKGSAAGETGQAAGGGAAKEATITGCLSAQPDKNGNYTISNGRYKKGVEVGPTDTVKDHAGHQVKLTGTWSAGEKGKKSFQVTNVAHIAAKCETAPGGATASEKPAGKASEGKPKKEKGAKSSGGGGNPPPQM